MHASTDAMIKLYQFPRPSPEWGVPNLSPFCLKVETYLKMVGLDHQVVDMFNPRATPKGKLPMIEDGGRRIPDSGFIIEYLKAAYGDKLDARLSAEERAVGHALRRMLEESLYFAMLYFRWIDEEGWASIKEAFFGSAPLPLRLIAPIIVRKDMRSKTHLQGIGRHSKEEITRIARADLEALSTILGDKPFLFGDQPTSFDAAAYGFVANNLYVPGPSPLRAICESTNLRGYADRIRSRYFAS